MIRSKRRDIPFSRPKPLEKAAVIALSIFNAISFLYSIKLKNALYALSSFASFALVFLPFLLEILFSLRISSDIKMCYWFLALGGPVLGNVYKFYHYIRPWDKILHMLSGFLAAAIGYSIPDFLLKEPPGKMLKCLFAVSFSVAIGGIWEIYEYLLDIFFKMDMQNDTIITSISSYMLGDQPGTIGNINIESVCINGEPFQTGYIDIGLIDTMKDMIQCLAGSILCAVTTAFQKPGSRFLSIQPI